jgi:hypothetical protein
LGKYIFSTEAIYNGNWVNDMMNGEGVLTLRNGDVIRTTWENNKRHGRGTVTTIDGKIK